METSRPEYETQPIIIAWLAIAFAVAVASYGSPASAWAVGLFQLRPIFVLGLMIPAALYLGYLFVRWLVGVETDWQPNLNVMFVFLVLYGLYVIIMTGGVVSSPLAPLCGMIPLIAGRYCGDAIRKKVLSTYLLGIIVVGGVSLASYIAPPSTYPAQGLWETFPKWIRVDVIIATVGIVAGIAMDLAMGQLRRNVQGSVGP
jgi:hypothetical protein